ncbi:MAG: (d)CMP kinase [Dehalococcoidia bacterium]|nr:(d)CMP kinase [Dehalococcoidia bacterium]
MPAPPAIAIDGPAASGKTTVGRALAARLGCRFVDTGLMYRAVTGLALAQGVPLDDDKALARLAERARIDPGDRVLANDADVTDGLWSVEVERNVSRVSAVPGVRRALVAQQRRLAERGVVMVGRDIGSVVLPGAAKVYLDASVGERARRRAAETGMPDEEQVRAELERRDRLDSERGDSPLRVPDGAVIVDTDGLDIDGVVAAVLEALGR